LKKAKDEKYLLTKTKNRWMNSNNKFPFAYFCDGYRHIRNNHEINDTDESDCHLWPCNNPYTRCNYCLHCLNGLDELNCSNSLCSFNELTCYETVYESSSVYYCLPITHLVDDYTQFNPLRLSRVIFLNNETTDNIQNYIFWNQTKCITMEHLYHGYSTPSVDDDDDVCLMPKYSKSDFISDYMFSRNKEKLCRFNGRFDARIQQRPYLLPSRLGYFPSIIIRKVSVQSIVQFNELRTIDLETDDFTN
jgi:hypothetical protein